MRGEGRVFQLKRRDGSLRSSRWWIAYSVGGREFRESAGRSEKEARKALKAKLKEIAGDRWIKPEQARMTLEELLGSYERDLEGRGAKDLGSIRSHIQLLKARFDHRRAVDLQVEDFREFQQERLAAGKAKQTIDHSLGVLRAAFRLARKEERLLRVPFVPMFHEKRVRQGFVERADKIAAQLPEPFASIVLFAAASAWRREEVESLRWEQVDLKAKEIRLADSKNGRPRTLPLDEGLFALMKRAEKRREFSRLVFHRKGQRAGDWRKRWRAACVAAGLGRWIKEGEKIVGYEGPIFHDLRRSGIRDMVRAGVPQSVVMAISGHRTISTFLRYDIASEEDKRAALEKGRAYREAK